MELAASAASGSSWPWVSEYYLTHKNSNHHFGDITLEIGCYLEIAKIEN